MNNNQIDVSAVSYLNLAIVKCEKLMPYITYNDKTPVWDGEIQLYKNEEHTADYVRRIPVQVKGTGDIEKYDINAKTIKYSLKKTDLENFMEDNGVIFFVVVIRGNEHKIFYRRLLPQDILDIIEDMGEQKTKVLEFQGFPNCEKDIMKIMSLFVRGRNGKQVLKSDKFFETGKINIDFLNPVNPYNIKQIEEELNSGNVYFSNIYKNGFKLPIESNKISDFIIIQYKDLPEEDGIKRRFVENRNGRYCYIGSNSDPNKRSVIWNETEKKADIKIQGNIDERITDTKFVLKYFQTSMKKEDYNEFENLLGDLSQIKDVLEYVGISRDFDLDDLSSTDRNNLFRLVTSIENEHIDSESTDKPFIASVFTFMGNNVLLYKKYLNGNKYKWVNFFRETIPCTFGFRDKEENDMLNISIFLVCDKSIFKRFINSDYDKILTGLKKSDITPDIANVLCLKTICNMISAYDEDNTNLEVLDTAYKFGEWLEVNTEIDKSCLLINQLQIKKRKNQLTPKDYSLLATLIQNEYDNIKFGAYTLLEDYENAKDSFSKIPAEEQNDLINSPIYRLYSELSENIAVAIG